MQNEIDSFMKYLYLINESCDKLTTDQFQKLCLIKTKVIELVDKVNIACISQAQKAQPTQTGKVSQLQQATVSEKQIVNFAEFITEKIENR